MRLLIELSSLDDKPITIPIHYNHLVQSAIYAALDSDFAGFLHDTGFEGAGRRFKLFTFSRLAGTFRINSDRGEITYTSPVKLVVSSPIDRFCESLINGIMTKNSMRIGPVFLRNQGMKVERPLVMADAASEHAETEIRVKTLSPVVVYSTFLRPEGGKYTCYFQPGDGDFTRLATENLRKKYQAVFGSAPPEGVIRIKPLHQPKLQILKYKNFVIKGYSGILSIKGPSSLLQVAIDAGLGAKNSMGFGLLELIADNKNECYRLKFGHH